MPRTARTDRSRFIPWRVRAPPDRTNGECHPSRAGPRRCRDPPPRRAPLLPQRRACGQASGRVLYHPPLPASLTSRQPYVPTHFMARDATDPLPSFCPEKRTAGIDWLRLIFDDPREARRALSYARGIQQEDKANGSRFRQWHFQGYHGWQSERIRFGRLDSKVIVETSGQWAPFIADPMRSFSGRCTRLDLQVTVRLSQPQQSFGTLSLWQSNRIPSPLPKYRRPRGQQQDSRGLWCGTVGRRTCEKYLRLYDKGVEAKCDEPARTWRLELEAKGRFGGALWQMVRTSTDVTALSWSACVQEWKSSGCYWPISESGSTSVVVERPARPAPEAGALMMWAAHTCRPVVQRLLRAFSPQEVLEVLGLTATVAGLVEHERRERAGAVDRPARPGVADHVQVGRLSALGEHAAGVDRERPYPC